MGTYRKFRNLIPCALMLFLSRTSCADDASKILPGDLVKHWQVLKSLSLEVARAIPEDAYTPKATLAESDPSEMGPFEMGALALENVLSCSVALGTPAPARFQSAFDRPMDSTKSGVIKSLTLAYDYCIDGFNQIEAADLFRLAPRGFKGHPAMKFDIVWDAFAHAAHRLGKAEMYLRLKGISPPDVGPKFDF
jgi:hypothetical protein